MYFVSYYDKKGSMMCSCLVSYTKDKNISKNRWHENCKFYRYFLNPRILFYSRRDFNKQKLTLDKIWQQIYTLSNKLAETGSVSPNKCSKFSYIYFYCCGIIRKVWAGETRALSDNSIKQSEKLKSLLSLNSRPPMNNYFTLSYSITMTKLYGEELAFTL